MFKNFKKGFAKLLPLSMIAILVSGLFVFMAVQQSIVGLVYAESAAGFLPTVDSGDSLVVGGSSVIAIQFDLPTPSTDTDIDGAPPAATTAIVNLNTNKPAGWTDVLINDGGTAAWESGSDMIWTDEDGDTKYTPGIDTFVESDGTTTLGAGTIDVTNGFTLVQYTAGNGAGNAICTDNVNSPTAIRIDDADNCTDGSGTEGTYLLDTSSVAATAEIQAIAEASFAVNNDAVAEVYDLTMRADSGDDLDTTSFLIYDTDGSVCIWFDVDDDGTLIGATDGACQGADRDLEVTGVVTDDANTAVATAVNTVISGDSKFGTTISNEVITVTTVDTVDLTDPADIDVGGLFAISMTTQGEDAVAADYFTLEDYNAAHWRFWIDAAGTGDGAPVDHGDGNGLIEIDVNGVGTDDAVEAVITTAVAAVNGSGSFSAAEKGGSNSISVVTLTTTGVGGNGKTNTEAVSNGTFTVANFASGFNTGTPLELDGDWSFESAGATGVFEDGEDLLIESFAGSLTYSAGADTTIAGLTTAGAAGSTTFPAGWGLSGYDSNTAVYLAVDDWIGIDVDSSTYYNGDALNDIKFDNTGTCVDADIASLEVFEDTNGNDLFDTGGTDVSIASNAGVLGAFMTATGTIYAGSDPEETIFLEVTFVASVTGGGCTFNARLPQTDGARFVSGDNGPSDTDVDSGDTITVDSQDPIITPVSIASDNADTTLAKVGDAVTLTWTADDTIQTPTVTIDGNTVTAYDDGTNCDTGNGADNDEWCASYTMQALDTEGVLTFIITTPTDLAGNAIANVIAVTDGTSVTFDETAPTLTTFTTSTSDATYGPSSNILIIATYDENVGVGSTMDVVLDNGVTVTLNNPSGVTNSGQYTVGTTGEDSLDLTVGSITSESVVDEAGNSQSSSTVPIAPNNIADTSDIVIDTTSPVIATLNSDESTCTGAGATVCKIGDDIIFTWDNATDGNTDEDPATVIADLTNFGGSATQLLYDDGTNGDAGADDIYTYTLTVGSDIGPDDDDGLFNFTVTADDLVGNTTAPVVGNSAPIDNIAPTVTPGTLDIDGTVCTGSGGTCIPGDDIIFTWDNVIDANADEAIVVADLTDFGGIAAQTLYDDGSNGDVTGADDTYTYTLTVGTVVDGTYDFDLTVDDDAGNGTGPITSTDTATLATPSALTATDVEPYSKVASASTNVKISFTPATDIPLAGKIEVVFPAGFDVSGINSVYTPVGLDGDLDLDLPITSQVVTIVRSGGSDALAGIPVSFYMLPVINPGEGSTGMYELRTRDSLDGVIDQKTDVDADTITPASSCGNAVCDAGETYAICPADCPPPGGGGGGGGSIPSNTDSNTTTSTTVSNIDTIDANQTYSRPVDFADESITINVDNDTATVEATTETGQLTIKPNSKSTISLTIPSSTTITASASWNGIINPPLIRSLTGINSAGEPIEGSDDELQRDDVTVLVKVGGNVPLEFSNPIELKIPVDLPDGSVINVYSSGDGNTWIAQGTAVVQDGYAIVMTDHLSYFALEMTDETASVVEEIEEAIARAPAFMDTTGHWAEDYINTIADLGIVSGKTATTFAPNDNITRAELTKIALKALNYAVDPGVGDTLFNDVSSSAWYAPYVVAARNAGIVQGYGDGSFSPNGLVNRAEALKILIEAAGFTNVESNFAHNYTSHADWWYAAFTDVPMGEWFAKFVAYAKDFGIAGGYADGTFGPGNSITRAEVAKIVVNIMGMQQ